MPTKEQLKRWRSLGLEFDDLYDQVAEKREKDDLVKNPAIISVRVIENPPFKYGDTITIEIVTKDLIGEAIEVEIFDNDRIVSSDKEKNDTLLWHHKFSNITTNKISFKVQLTDNMRKRAHKPGETELSSAEYYIKVSSSKTTDFYSSEFDVENKFRVNYFTQQVFTPKGDSVYIQDNAIPVLNANKQTVAFITPEEKLFVWLDEYEWQGYFEDGIKKYNKSYIFYVRDKIEREESPISWGIYLVTADSGEFVLNLLTDPKNTITGLGLALKKIVTLDFSLAETWDRIQRADATDATYVVSTILMSYLATRLGKVPKEDIHKLAEIVEDVAQKGSKKLTWAEVLQLFKRALVFEADITKELLKKYPIAEGYIHVSRLYLKVNNVVSIADNCIYSTVTKEWILNETKYGIRNALRRNQQVIENAIKEDGLLEIRSATANLPKEFKNVIPKIEQGSSIKISEILRSHSLDGKITSETIKTIWP